MLIPSLENFKHQSFLIFIDNEIQAIKISEFQNYPKKLELQKYFQDYSFKEFQIFVSIDFLLILRYEPGSKKWIGCVFSLNLTMTEELFECITSFNLNEDENTKFSLFETNNKKYLFSISNTEKIPIIKFREIISNLSGIETNFTTNEENNSTNYEIPLGNCIMNYFFHCFEKYPLIGAISFRRKNESSIKFNLYVGNNNMNKINEFQEYIKELIKQCEKDKEIYFHDINFSFISENNKYNENNSSIGYLIIKILEITPIQIAKIFENKFIVMSNWLNIEKSLSIGKNYDPNAYSKMINFCIKDSIFEFFNFPVIVICCFGTQSIGKSTFLNELTGSLFNVSGMRCTEGIWMSVQLFENNKIISKEKCCKNCQFCQSQNNKCCLFINHKNECLCKNCKCDEECVLKSCNYACCLKKDHKNLIKCTFKDCKCDCKCNCQCKSNFHEHKCQKCKTENKIKCFCKCTCTHLCDIPVINHNFICVSLDFEGLGTFERKEEQDIQMALVGSAIGNNIIFRIGNSFDKFIQSILDKLSVGSRKIQFIDINQFFGGSLFFSPKDITSTEKKNLEKEFVDKIEMSVRKWRNDNSDYNNKKKYDIFGLFDDWIFIPTPPYKRKAFYETLRKEGISNVIENSWKFQKHPIYKRGKEFSDNLKLFLTVTYMNNYQILSNYKSDKIEDYIKICGNNPFEICGILKIEENNRKNIIVEKKGLKLYINDELIQNLDIDINNQIKLDINNSLIIDNLKLDASKFFYEINDLYVEDYDLKVIVSKKKDNNFSVELLFINDYGLILKIPEDISQYINKNELNYELYKLWDKIAEVLGFNEKDASIHFKDFINIIIKRRNNIVNKWFEKITEDFSELRNKYENNYNIYGQNNENENDCIRELNNNEIIDDEEEEHDSILNHYWKLCEQKCKKCFNRCYLTQNHKEEHKCFYDHICKEKCEICSKSKCDEKNCELKCIIPLSHEDLHSCGHYHQCIENCSYKEETTNCKGKCILKFGHKEDHFCGLEEPHHCKGKCYLYNISENCKGECILNYPHEGKHNCGIEHLCNEECNYYNKYEGCRKKCNKIYGHKDEHKCTGKHICKENCFLKGKANGCGGKCTLEYPHKNEHDCQKEHKCPRDCQYKDISVGCKMKCNLKYGHDGKDSCLEIHYCKERCSFGNCLEKCKFKFPHPEQEKHLCKDKKDHPCYEGVCYLKDKSSNCKKSCNLKYGHEPPCKCEIEKEKHICGGKCCIDPKCNKDCILVAEHKGKCLCGSCQCPEVCIFKECSRNCNGKCQYKSGHDGKDPHICNSKHYCKESCIYAEKSRNCKKECNLEYSHSGEHICNVEHFCNEKCYLFAESKECKEYCKLPINHSGIHLCSLDREKHICNKPCSLNKLTKEGYCKINCSLPAKHKGNCICQIPENSHICNHKCDFCEENCSLVTPLVKSHASYHICSLKLNEHKCREECYLKGKTRTKGSCLGICNNYYGHEGKHICKDDIHLCDEDCTLKDIKGCKGKCNKPFGHPISRNNVHDCKGKHLCPKKCYYYSKFGEKSDCGKYCILNYGHEGECVCLTPDKHLCNMKCFLSEETRGCNIDCKLKYKHDGQHQCDIPLEGHTCKALCEICHDDTICGHVYDHGTDNKLKCFKCNGKKCELGKKGHLCGIVHDCDENCEIQGLCGIDSLVRIINKKPEKYTTKLGEEITYEEVIIFESAEKKKCMEKIPKNEFSHQGKHNCKSSVHRCGFQCRQCEYYCNEPYGHEGLHKGTHGNITNSSISISNKSKVAQIIKDNKTFDLMEGEEVKMFYCDQYCKEQGQGHIHLFESSHKINHNDVKQINSPWFSNYLYECKCSYYWENILKFESLLFTKEDKNKFSLCNWKCNYLTHPSQNPEYCQLKLWHAPEIQIPKEVYGKWIYKGHIFKCEHSIGIYTIFLLDISGSMGSNNAYPVNKKIRKKLNNMLGAAIEAIENYCKKRAQNSKKDKCALISFNDKAEKIFEDFDIENVDIMVNMCLENLKPGGETFIKNAFKKAEEIVQNINRIQVAPIIILLTDGLDMDPKGTLSLLEKVR